MTYTVALIGARSGSSLKNKNIRLLAGRPLLAYSIRAAKKCPRIDRVIVSTDSLKYADIAHEYGAETPFLRPAEISGDLATDYQFIKHVLDWLKKVEKLEPEMIVHLRPTTPLRDPRIVCRAIEALEATAKATALRSVHEMPESAYKAVERSSAGKLKMVGWESDSLDRANDPRQKFTKTFHANGYVDVLRTAFIRANKSIHGYYVFGFITPPITEVDTKEDFKMLEFQVQRKPELVNRLFGG